MGFFSSNKKQSLESAVSRESPSGEKEKDATPSRNLRGPTTTSRTGQLHVSPTRASGTGGAASRIPTFSRRPDPPAPAPWKPPGTPAALSRSVDGPERSAASSRLRLGGVSSPAAASLQAHCLSSFRKRRESRDEDDDLSVASTASLSRLPRPQGSVAGSVSGSVMGLGHCEKGSDHLKVVVRVRPLNSQELSNGGRAVLLTPNFNTVQTLLHPRQAFTFGAVLGEGTSQKGVFQACGNSVVENALMGFNACVFAYGQTGAGKTHTMLGGLDRSEGADETRGVIPRLFERLFERLGELQSAAALQGQELTVACTCTFVEIYQEQITDLLSPGHGTLQLRETNGCVTVDGASEHRVTSADDVIQLVCQGAEKRKVAGTDANRESSRSHGVLSCVLALEKKAGGQSVGRCLRPRLHLVDLAGSEHSKATGADKAPERAQETAAINQSLTTLGRVISALNERQGGRSRAHIPYRDSKLTRLLQDSLGGNSKTVMIATVSPSSHALQESINTLRFASRASGICNTARVNEDKVGREGALLAEVQRLTAELLVLREAANRDRAPATPPLFRRSSSLAPSSDKGLRVTGQVAAYESAADSLGSYQPTGQLQSAAGVLGLISTPLRQPVSGGQGETLAQVVRERDELAERLRVTEERLDAKRRDASSVHATLESCEAKLKLLEKDRERSWEVIDVLRRQIDAYDKELQLAETRAATAQREASHWRLECQSKGGYSTPPLEAPRHPRAPSQEALFASAFDSSPSPLGHEALSGSSVPLGDPLDSSAPTPLHSETPSPAQTPLSSSRKTARKTSKLLATAAVAEIERRRAGVDALGARKPREGNPRSSSRPSSAEASRFSRSRAVLAAAQAREGGPLSAQPAGVGAREKENAPPSPVASPELALQLAFGDQQASPSVKERATPKGRWSSPLTQLRSPGGDPPSRGGTPKGAVARSEWWRGGLRRSLSREDSEGQAEPKDLTLALGMDASVSPKHKPSKG